MDADAVATQPWTEQENRRAGTPLRNQHGRRTTSYRVAYLVGALCRRQLTPALRCGDVGLLADDERSSPGGAGLVDHHPAARPDTRPRLRAPTVTTSCLTASVIVRGVC